MIKERLLFASAVANSGGGGGGNLWFAAASGVHSALTVSAPVRIPGGHIFRTETHKVSGDAGLGRVFFGIKADGTLWVRGSFNSYDAGTGVESGFYNTPVQIGTDTDWNSVASIGYGGCATKTNGTLWTWGSNSGYATGRNTDSGYTTVPTQVGSDTNWDMVFSRADGGFATKKSPASIHVWGSGSSACSGLGNSNPVPTPTQITALNGKTIYYARTETSGTIFSEGGTHHVCGSNNYYKLGVDNGGVDVTTVTSRTGGSRAFVLGGFVSSHIGSGNLVYSYGDNTAYGTGQGTNTGFTKTPTAISSFPSDPLTSPGWGGWIVTVYKPNNYGIWVAGANGSTGMALIPGTDTVKWVGALPGINGIYLLSAPGF